MRRRRHDRALHFATGYRLEAVCEMPKCAAAPSWCGRSFDFAQDDTSGVVDLLERPFCVLPYFATAAASNRLKSLGEATLISNFLCSYARISRLLRYRSARMMARNFCRSSSTEPLMIV